MSDKRLAAVVHFGNKGCYVPFCCYSVAKRPFQNVANFAKCRDVHLLYVSCFSVMHDWDCTVQRVVPLGVGGRLVSTISGCVSVKK